MFAKVHNALVADFNLSGQPALGASPRNRRDGTIALLLSVGWPVLALGFLVSLPHGERRLFGIVGWLTAAVFAATWFLVLRTVRSRAEGGVLRAVLAALVSLVNLGLALFLLVVP